MSEKVWNKDVEKASFLFGTFSTSSLKFVIRNIFGFKPENVCSNSRVTFAEKVMKFGETLKDDIWYLFVPTKKLINIKRFLIVIYVLLKQI